MDISIRPKKIRLFALDRDGTINRDDNFYLGSSPNWKNQVEILPGVVEGIKLLNEISGGKVYVVTNQSGVAIAEPRFADLTEERMHEVNAYILNLLAEQGARVEGYVACPYVDDKYVKKASERGWKIHQQYVQDGHRDLKPNIGMLEKCAERLGVKLQDTELFVIGDRSTDVELGLNGGGEGILVLSSKTSENKDLEKITKEMSEGTKKYRIGIAHNFPDAVEYIKDTLNARHMNWRFG